MEYGMVGLCELYNILKGIKLKSFKKGEKLEEGLTIINTYKLGRVRLKLSLDLVLCGWLADLGVPLECYKPNMARCILGLAEVNVKLEALLAVNDFARVYILLVVNGMATLSLRLGRGLWLRE